MASACSRCSTPGCVEERAMSPTEVEALELRLLLDAIHERYGYDLREYDRASIQRRMRLALAKSGLSHLGELLHHVLRDPALFALVLDELTVRVSEMFRSPPFYRAFRERVLPMLRTYPQIKLWHAGCANGEEVYTSAILLDRKSTRLNSSHVKISYAVFCLKKKKAAPSLTTAINSSSPQP